MHQNGADEIFMDSWDVRRRVGNEVPLSFILRPAPPDLESKAPTTQRGRATQVASTVWDQLLQLWFLPEPNLLWAQEAFALLD